MASLFVLCVSQGDGHFETQLPGSVYRRHWYEDAVEEMRCVMHVCGCYKGRGRSDDECDLESTLCIYNLLKGNLFVLIWVRVRQVRRGRIFSELLMCGGSVRSILLLPLVARCCKFVSDVHPVAVHNAAFCMICSLLMLVEDARGDHIEETYSRCTIDTNIQYLQVETNILSIKEHIQMRQNHNSPLHYITASHTSTQTPTS